MRVIFAYVSIEQGDRELISAEIQVFSNVAFLMFMYERHRGVPQSKRELLQENQELVLKCFFEAPRVSVLTFTN